MLTNALEGHIIVLLMLTVLIIMVHTPVPVNQDILEMDTTVQVRLYNRSGNLHFYTLGVDLFATYAYSRTICPLEFFIVF